MTVIIHRVTATNFAMKIGCADEGAAYAVAEVINSGLTQSIELLRGDEAERERRPRAASCRRLYAFFAIFAALS